MDDDRNDGRKDGRAGDTMKEQWDYDRNDDRAVGL